MQVTLKYYSGGSMGSRAFDVYSVQSESVEYYKRSYRLLNGNVSDGHYGYRRLIDVSLLPLGNAKDVLFWIYAFAVSSDQRVVIDGTEYSVLLRGKDVVFDYLQRAHFGDALSLRFVERDWTSYTDDGAAFTLKPVQSLSLHGISGNVFSCYGNFTDDESIELHQTGLSFLDEREENITFGYKHRFVFETGVLISETERNWLRTYLMKSTKYFDTRSLDSTNGRLFTVAFEGQGLTWNVVQGIDATKGAVLELVEKSLRTSVEGYTEPDATEFILDTDVLDNESIVLG